MRCDGDGVVELLVSRYAAISLGDLDGHDRERVVDRLHLCIGATLGRQLGEFHLERFSGLDDLGQAVGVFAECSNRCIADWAPDHHGAVTVTHGQDALHFECYQCLTQRGPADAQLRGQFAFRR